MWLFAVGLGCFVCGASGSLCWLCERLIAAAGLQLVALTLCRHFGATSWSPAAVMRFKSVFLLHLMCLSGLRCRQLVHYKLCVQPTSMQHDSVANVS